MSDTRTVEADSFSGLGEGRLLFTDAGVRSVYAEFSIEECDRPVPGMLIVRLMPRGPTFSLKPRGPRLIELPRRPIFHRTPGATLIDLRNRQPMNWQILASQPADSFIHRFDRGARSTGMRGLRFPRNVEFHQSSPAVPRQNSR